MSETQTFACPSCGAALTAAGAAKEIKCPYCGSTVVVPEALRAPDPITIQPVTIDLSGMTMPDTTKEVATATKVAVGIFGLSFLLPAVIGIVITVFVLIFTCVIMNMVTTTINQVVH